MAVWGLPRPVSTTRAPGTTAPEESVTCPRRDAVCAEAAHESRKLKTSNLINGQTPLLKLEPGPVPLAPLYAAGGHGPPLAGISATPPAVRTSPPSSCGWACRRLP